MHGQRPYKRKLRSVPLFRYFELNEPKTFSEHPQHERTQLFPEPDLALGRPSRSRRWARLKRDGLASIECTMGQHLMSDFYKLANVFTSNVVPGYCRSCIGE